MTGVSIAVAAILVAGSPAPELSLTLVGNAGVVLSDGFTTLLVDLPYESGAFGYMTYDPDALRPSGTTVSVVTHAHRDHFDRELFMMRDGWRVIGPPSVTDGLPASRVIPGDSVDVGRFSVVAIPTPHTDDHRSYRVRWQDRVIYFTGDTEVPAPLSRQPRVDVLFITPWLSCAAGTGGLRSVASRSIAYHLAPDGSDRTCEGAEVLPQGTTFKIAGGTGELGLDEVRQGYERDMRPDLPSVGRW